MPDITLSENKEAMLRRKFDRYAKASNTVSKTTYYIHVGTRIIRHKDTAELFNMLKKEYAENNGIVIW